MGRDGGQFGVLAADDDDVAIADAGVKMKDVVGTFPLQGGDQLMAFSCGDVAGGEIDHGDAAVVRTVKGDEVAAECRLFVGQMNPHGGGLKRSPAGIVAFRCVAEQ